MNVYYVCGIPIISNVQYPVSVLPLLNGMYNCGMPNLSRLSYSQNQIPYYRLYVRYSMAYIYHNFNPIYLH